MCAKSRSNHPQLFHKMFRKIRSNTPGRSLFCDKAADQACNLIAIESPAQVLSCSTREFHKFF